MTSSVTPSLLALRQLTHFATWLLALTLCSSLYAADLSPRLVLDGREQGLDLQPFVSLLRDPAGEFSLEQLEAGTLPFASAAARRDLNFGFTPQVLWLRLPLRSAASQPSSWRIEFSYSALDRVELFQRGADGLQHQQGGDSIAPQARSIDHRNPLFSVELQPGEERTLWFRAQTSGNLTLSLALWQAEAFARHSTAQYVILAGYFGMLLALASYNLLLFSALRERAYLFYVLFVCSFAGGMLCANGFATQFLWPDAQAWNNHALPFLLTLAAAFAVLFVRDFLNGREQAPRWFRGLGLLGGSQLLIAPVVLLLPLVHGGRILAIIVLLNCLVLFTYALVGIRQRILGAGIFLCAWSLLMVGASILVLRTFGLLPSNFITLNAMQIGSSLEMLLLSFGLAARFNQLKQQKACAQQATLHAQQQTMATLQAQERVLEQRVAERTDELAAANARLRALTLQDPLTGLANRTALKQHLEQALRRSQRQGRPLAVLLLDLDGFKPVNDRLGHEAGDQVLRQIAHNLQSCARATDLVTRLGGDEFVLVCEDVRSDVHARQLAERFLQAVGTPLQLGEVWLTLGASIGIAMTLGDALSITQLLRHADAAMYQAKAAGRNRVQLADSSATNS